MLRRIWRTTPGLIAITALGFALATAAIGAVAYEITHEALEEQLDHRIAAETSGLLAEAEGGGLPALAAAIVRRNAARSTASPEYLLVDDGGTKLAGSVNAMVPGKTGFEEFFHYRLPSGDGRIGQSLTTVVPGGVLVVAANRADLDQIDRTMGLLFAGALTVIALAGAAMALLLGWTIRHRLNRIDTTAQAIIAGDLARRIPRDGSDSEFDRLSGTLNRMLDRIETLMDNLRQVSSDIAHDLRTPLTRLHASLDSIAEATGDEARVAQIDRARAQMDDILAIFSALLRIAEIEGMSDRLPKERFDLSILIDQMVETYRPDFDDGGRSLHLVAPSGMEIVGDRRLISQALTNLLDNCLRHTPTGTAVTVSVRDGEGLVRITVADDGPGAPAAERPRLFDRFARAEFARSTAGHGLGLSMVRAIAQAHGGDARILDDWRGFAVEIGIGATVH